MRDYVRLRYECLRAFVPELFSEPGTLLYVGAYGAADAKGKVKHARMDYGRELVEAGNELTVLEVWEPALEALMQSRFARHVAHAVLGDVRRLPAVDLPHERYDYALWWHGPEHVEKWEVEGALRGLERLTRKTVVLASPWGHFEAGTEFGNPHNAHRCHLYPGDYEAWGYCAYVAMAPKDRPGGNIMAWRRLGK